MSKNKIVNHPDKEEIVHWLTNGVSVREVERRLMDKYSKSSQEHLKVSFSSIQEFKKKYLNISGKVLSDIKEAQKLTNAWGRQKANQEAVQNLSAYKEAISRIAKNELDITEEIIKVFSIIELRMEALYNKLVNGDNRDKDSERILQTYLDQFMRVLDQHKKYVEGYREQVDVNVNVSVMSEQISVLREAIREILSEIDVALVPIFMEKLNAKMRDLVIRDTSTSGGHAALLDRALSGEDND